MLTREIFELFRKAGKRAVLVGSEDMGAVIGLDLEGRIYYSYRGEILNRVNTDAIAGFSSRAGYLNPGGDGLWPAPEGTSRGYQYGTGGWRVPPGLVQCRFQVVEQAAGSVVIEGEVDLINSQGVGFPTIFRRAVSIDGTKVSVRETIQYLGAKTLKKGEFLLAPWSLCQFDVEAGDRVIYPAADVVDLYDPSGNCRYDEDGFGVAPATLGQRYQIAMDASVPWIELQLVKRGLKLRRTAPVLEGYIDISDAPPECEPSDFGVRYSVYNDASGFMEIEAVGGCPAELVPGTELSFVHVTEII